MAFEIGIMTFGEVTEDPVTGRLPSPRQRVRETIEQAKVADEVGLDVFGVGEHHRRDFVLYRASAEQAGHDAHALAISINTHGYVGHTLLREGHHPDGLWRYAAKEHLAAIERLGTQVAPVVRPEVAAREEKAAA